MASASSCRQASSSRRRRRRRVAQTAAPGQPVDEQKPPTWQAGATRTVRLFPSSDVYPVYVADPHRPTNAVVAELLHPHARAGDELAADAPGRRRSHRHAARRVFGAGRAVLAGQPRRRPRRHVRLAVQARRDRVGWQLRLDGDDRDADVAARLQGGRPALVGAPRRRVSGTDRRHADQLHARRGGVRRGVAVPPAMARVW